MDQEERIVLEAEEGPVLEGVAKANAALEKFEKTGVKAGSGVGQSFQKSGETIIRAMDRSRASAERLVASIEKKAALAGKTGVERLVAERDQLIQRLAGEERSVERARVAYDKLIAVHKQAENANRSLGEGIQNFVRNPLQSLSNGIQTVVTKLGAGGVVGVGLVAGFAAAAKAAMGFVARIGTAADLMSNMATRTGLTVNQIDKLKAMAKLADVNLESLESGVRALAEGLADLGSGGDRARDAIRRLGVQTYDTSGNQREMGQVLINLLQRLGKVQNQAERVALANATLGRGAIELLPLIKNYDVLEKEVTRLGFGMDEYLLKRLGHASDEVDKLGLRWELLKRKLAKPAMAVVEIVTKVVEAVSGEGGPRQPSPWERIVAARTRRPTPLALRLPVPMPDTGEGFRARVAAEAQAHAQDVVRGGLMAEAFQRQRQATIEGMRERIRAIGDEQRPMLAAMLSGQLGGEAFAQKRAEFDALEREKAGLDARIKAIEEARQHAEQQAKRAAKAREELEHFKFRVGLAASGARIGEIVAPERETAAATQRAIEYQTQQFQAGLHAEASRLNEDVRNLERALQMAKRVDEEKVSSLQREARLSEQLIRLRTGPGGEAQAIEQTYQLRLEYARREFDIHKDRWRFEEAVQDAQIDRITKIAELERRRFDDLRRSAEGIFDVLLTRSQSLGDAILNIFKTAVLTPIKQAFSTMIAGMMMPAHGAGGGGLRSALGLGGLAGAGAIPSLGAGGGMFGAGAGGGFSNNPLVFSAAPQGSHAMQAAPMFAPLAMGKNLAGMGPMAAALGGGLLMLGGMRRGGGLGSAMTVGGGALLGSQLVIGGTLMGAVPGAGLGLALAGLRRGGVSGMLMAAGGGAMVGWRFGGPLGAAIGAGVGAVAGLFRMFIKGAEEKLREKIRAVYGVEMRDKGILRQILDIAKQGFGGNLDVAIRSPQIRDLIELYAMTTGQRMSGLPATPRPASLVQSGGTLYQAPAYSNGSLLPSLGGLPAAGVASNAGTIVIPLQIDSKPVANVIIKDGRVVTSGAITAMKGNAGRRELTALQLSPGTLTS